MRRLLSGILVVMVALSLGCAAGYARTPAPIYGSAGEKPDAGLIDAINDFGFRILQSTVVPDENVVVSPVSLHSLLTDISRGARGDTDNEMDAVLGITDNEAVLPEYANLITRLRGVDGATVNVANAELSGIGSPAAGRLVLSRVVHHVFLKVDEKGTEAAAVSIGGAMEAGAEVDVGRFYLIADRPFLFAIAEEESGCLLFAGVIGNPRW